jgi:hypothetical protein
MRGRFWPRPSLAETASASPAIVEKTIPPARNGTCLPVAPVPQQL